MTIDMSRFYQVFFDEAGEHLAAMEGLLLELDVDAPDLETLNAIFRAAHSIKGGAGTFGFHDMAQVTHVLETLLDRLRKQETRPTVEMIDAFLQAGDLLNAQLAAHREGREYEDPRVGQVCERLDRLSQLETISAGTAPADIPDRREGGELADRVSARCDHSPARDRSPCAARRTGRNGFPRKPRLRAGGGLGLASDDFGRPGCHPGNLCLRVRPRGHPDRG